MWEFIELEASHPVAVLRLKKPPINALDETALHEALACDIRLASQEATFHLPEVSYGFIPGWGTIGRLVEAVGTARAAEMLLVGERISATRAQVIGLVSRITVPDDLMGEAETLAVRLATQPPMAVRYAKAALQGGATPRSPDRKAWEASCFAAVWGSHEWEQGLHRLFKTTTATEQEESSA